MAYYYPIQNERLRLLVIASESIHSLDEKQLQKVILQIAMLPPEGQEAMISALEDEQKQIIAAQAARGISKADQLITIHKKTEQVRIIRRNYEIFVRVEEEKVEVGRVEREADNLLRDLDTV